jgi:hypothetical protein
MGVWKEAARRKDTTGLVMRIIQRTALAEFGNIALPWAKACNSGMIDVVGRRQTTIHAIQHSQFLTDPRFRLVNGSAVL